MHALVPAILATLHADPRTDLLLIGLGGLLALITIAAVVLAVGAVVLDIFGQTDAGIGEMIFVGMLGLLCLLMAVFLLVGFVRWSWAIWGA